MEVTGESARIKLDRNLHLRARTRLKLPLEERLGCKLIEHYVPSAFQNFYFVDVSRPWIHFEQEQTFAIPAVEPEFGGI